eukprot:gene370-55_t
MWKVVFPASVAATAPHAASLAAQDGTSTAASVGADNGLEAGSTSPVLKTVWAVNAGDYDNIINLRDSPADGACLDQSLWLDVSGDDDQCWTKCDSQDRDAYGYGLTSGCGASLWQEYGPDANVLCVADGATCEAKCAARSDCGAYQVLADQGGSDVTCHLIRKHSACALNSADVDAETFYRQTIESHLYTDLSGSDLASVQEYCHWGEGIFVSGTGLGVDGAYQIATTYDGDATTTPVGFNSVSSTNTASAGACGYGVSTAAGLVATEYVPDFDSGACSSPASDWASDTSALGSSGAPLYDLVSWAQAKFSGAALSCAAPTDHWREFADTYAPHNNDVHADLSAHLCTTLCGDAATRGGIAECAGWSDDFAGSSSNALCASVDTCLSKAEEYGYQSVDMHHSGYRCYLNGAYSVEGYNGADATGMAQWEPSDDYDLYVFDDHAGTSDCADAGSSLFCATSGVCGTGFGKAVCANTCQLCGERCSVAVNGDTYSQAFSDGNGFPGHQFLGAFDNADGSGHLEWTRLAGNANGFFALHTAAGNFRSYQPLTAVPATSGDVVSSSYFLPASAVADQQATVAALAFYAELPVVAGSVSQLCYDHVRCPTATTCAYNDHRFDNEVALALDGCSASASLAACGAGNLDTSEWSSSNCQGCDDDAELHFNFPKGLVSEFISYYFLESTSDETSWIQGSTMLRSSANSGRWQITSLPAPAAGVARSMVTVVAADPVSLSNSALNGVDVSAGAGFNPIGYDFLVVETFDVDSSITANTGSVGLSFAFDGTPTVVQFSLSGGASSTVSGVTCADGLCSFTGSSNAAYGVATAAGSAPGAVSQVVLLNQGTSVAIFPTEDLSDGWTVGEVTLFSDESCTTPLESAGWTLKSNENPAGSDFVNGGSAGYDSKCKSCSRGDGSGPWITLEHASRFEVLCVTVNQGDCEACPNSLALFTGVGDSLSFVPGNALSSWGGNMYSATGRSAPIWSHAGAHTNSGPGCVMSLTNSCGRTDTQIYGEKLATKTQADISNSGGAGACECARHCEADPAAGCKAWKYYEEGDFKRCILMDTIHPDTRGKSTATRRVTSGASDGWWGEVSQPSPGWTSGFASHFAASLSVSGPGAVLGDITVSVGGSLPFNGDAKNNLAPRQRIKVVDCEDVAGGECHSSCEHPIAETASGLSCNGDWICSGAPAAADRSSASWGGISIFPRKNDASYKVCHCSGFCHEAVNWQTVAGHITIPGAQYSWDFAEGSGAINRNSDIQSRMLCVSRPPFHDVSNDITSQISIELNGPSFAGCTGTDAAGVGTVGLVAQTDQACFEVELTAEVVEGDYVVCRDGATPIGRFRSSEPSVPYFLQIEQLHIDAPRNNGPYAGQIVSTSTLNGVVARTIAGQGIYKNSQSVFKVFDTCGGSEASVSVTIDPAATTSSGYGVSIDATGAAAGSYDLLYCDAQSAPPTGTGDFYGLDEFQGPTGAGVTVFGGSGLDGEADLCTTKCGAGCSGDNCGGCDYWAGGTFHAETLCVDLNRCEEIANGASAEGYFHHRSADLCVVTSTWSGSSKSDADWDGFAHATGAPDCTFDCSSVVGELVVTEKAYVGANYVVAPGQEAVVEVLGENLDVNHDRIMFVDCQGTCGQSAASAEVDSGGLLWAPVNAFVDPPVADVVAAGAAAADYVWTSHANMYCGGNHLANSAAEQYNLFTMCSKNCIGGSDCDACAAFNAHWDQNGTPTYGLTVDQAKEACERIETCHGFEINGNRVHFNKANTGTGSCAHQVEQGTTYPSNDYTLYVRSIADNSRRLDGTDFINQPAYDFGFSWSSMLRFWSATFSSGGTFKVCLCDSALSSANVACADKSDYTVEVGTVHSSGLECLISQSQFQRGVCQSQFPFGGADTGVRCYGAGAAPSIT